ncbi:MAG: hypothetical protein J7L21_02880 [Sulfurimonas sp.]|nr:hypothetical protein [Sulfurimonas sp.]
MLSSETDFANQLEAIAVKEDKSAKVIILSTQAERAQLALSVTFGILVAPNNQALRKAIIDFCLSFDEDEDTVAYQSSNVDVVQNVLTDVIQVRAIIFYK